MRRMTTVLLAGLILALAACSSTPAAVDFSQRAVPAASPSVANASPTVPPEVSHVASDAMSAAQAPMEQLEAAVRSIFDESDHAHAVTSLPEGMNDYIQAISVRCYPDLGADESAELETLHAQVQSSTGEQAYELSQAYFARSTELC